MPNREELLQDIRPGMKLTKNFFMRIYGYEITYPGFAAVALEKLEGLYILYARGNARHPEDLYQNVVKEADERQEQGMKEAAQWYAKQLNDKWERQVKNTIAGNRKAQYQFAGFPEDW